MSLEKSETILILKSAEEQEIVIRGRLIKQLTNFSNYETRKLF